MSRVRLLLFTALLAMMYGPAQNPTRAVVEVYVRVNQVGYRVGAPKRAAVLASTALNDTAFHVVETSGKSAFEGKASPASAQWSDAYPHVYVLDFSDLDQAGDYLIEVSG